MEQTRILLENVIIHSACIFALKYAQAAYNMHTRAETVHIRMEISWRVNSYSDIS